jgi:hypothetical protein
VSRDREPFVELLNHKDRDGITITSGVEEMPLPDSRRPSHGGITIAFGVEEMPLLTLSSSDAVLRH